MKKLLFVLLVVFAGYLAALQSGITLPGSSAQNNAGDSALEVAFTKKKSDLHVQGKGRVINILSDDLQGSRHQRFILRLDSGQTVLVAHNIDLAPKIPGLQVGDIIKFAGEYEWNDKGGVVHWTHHDPDGEHVGGWLKHRGAVYR